MRTRTAITTLVAAGLLTFVGCAPEDSAPDTPEKKPAASQEKNAPADDAEPEADAEEAADEEAATLPDMTGKDLQAAQDEAQAAGFYALDDQDASGQNRFQVLDRNWIVCSQEPAAGTHPTDTPVTLYAVKDDETC